MVEISTINSFLTENLLVLIALIFILIIVYLLTRAVVSYKRLGLEKKYAEIDLERRKIDAINEKQKLEQLRESAAILTDKERQRLEAIRVDRGVLARRSVALMNEIEERLGRLERGTENAKLYQTMNDISKQEKKLFQNKKKVKK